MKEECPPSHHQATSIPKTSALSTRFNPEDLPKEDVTNFDEGSIIDHYHHLKYQQYRQLSEYNLSDTLKQKLFGFPQDFLFFNHYQPENIIISNHPMKGRIIMNKIKHNNYTKQKLRERNIKGKTTHHNVSQDSGASQQRMKDISSGFTVGKTETVVVQDNSPASHGSQVRLMHEQTV